MRYKSNQSKGKSIEVRSLTDRVIVIDIKSTVTGELSAGCGLSPADARLFALELLEKADRVERSEKGK